MRFDMERHHRRSIRLQGYDYSEAGGYFVTVCTSNRNEILGSVIDGDSRPNDLGRVVSEIWNALPDRFPSVVLDAFVVMPNHIHGVLFLGGDPDADYRDDHGRMVMPASQNAASSAQTPTLGAVMRAFKSVSGIACNRLTAGQGQAFWQRNYYEHIIRTDRELDQIRRYIFDNPAQWSRDQENPEYLLVNGHR